MITKKNKRGAILPRSASDPMGTDALERRAIKEFNRRVTTILKEYKRLLNLLPAEKIVVNRTYVFRVDGGIINSILEEASLFVDSILLEGGWDHLWFYKTYIEVAAIRGLSQAYQNLGAQSPSYKASKVSMQSILSSEPHRRRMALVAAREFEEMQGLAGNIKANMARVLTDGIARGLNPRDIAKTLTEQAGIEKRRSHRIARTEITTALRRARLDEADEAKEQYNLKSKEMHLSALSPTTRVEHAARHGKLFTTEEQREWWAIGANSINCKCTTVTVLVDDKGSPLVPEIVEKARRTRRERQGKGSK